MPKPEPRYLCWLDMETTGLDPVMDPPLEVAIIVTDMNLDEVPNGRYHTLIDPGEWAFERLREDEYVTEMHTKNGLLRDLEIKLPKTMQGAESDILIMLTSLPWGMNECVFLAGTGVAAFDRQVIAAHMPNFHDFLDYRMLDIGHIRRFLSDIVQVADEEMPTKADDNHRAEGDVENALWQARGMRGLLTSIVED